MFNAISWGQYLTVVILFLVLYYTYVAFKYFRWEILSLVGIRKVDNDAIAIPLQSSQKSNENPADYLPKPSLNNQAPQLLQPFRDEVTAYLNQTEHGISKAEMTDALQQLIEKYPVAQNREYRNELVYFITALTDAKYPQLLKANDISQLWN